MILLGVFSLFNWNDLVALQRKKPWLVFFPPFKFNLQFGNLILAQKIDHTGAVTNLTKITFGREKKVNKLDGGLS